MTPEDRRPGRQQLTTPLLMGLALLSASAPFSIDMYLPALPGIVDDLDTTQSMVQLTLSGFLVGLAVGQLIVGPVSDAVGRKKLMVGGAVVAMIAAVLAALSPDIEILILARLIQGLGSGACVVLARAVVPDLARGEAAARAFSLLMTIQGVAPIVAPVVGGLLVEPLGWRGLFWVLAGVALLQLLVSVFVVRESMPVGDRSPATVRGVLGNYAYVLGNPGYRGYLVTFAFGFGAMFSYISASPFVLQEQLGLSVRVYSLIFAVNALGLVTGTYLNGRLIGRVHTPAILRGALINLLVGSLAVFAVLQWWPVLWLILPLLFLTIAQVGVILGNSTALGTGLVRERAGSASALMGFTQFGLAGLISPLMGLGDDPGVTMAIGMVVCAAVALLGWLYAWRRS